MLTYTVDDIAEVVRSAEQSPLKRERMVKALRKAERVRGVPSVPFHLLPESIRWNLCRLRLSRGQWDWNGWELRSDWRVKVSDRQPMRFWDGKPCKLLLIADEGIGDEITALSCLRKLMAETEVTVECDSRLQEVVERSFGVRTIPRQHSWDLRKECDAFLPMLDLLPRYLKSPEDCDGKPFLVPDPDRVELWRSVLPKNPVGYAFKGRHGVIERPEGNVSLQYDDPECILDAMKDFADLVNLVAALDRVVSCPQSVVHLAGALGIKTDVYMPKRGTGEVNNTLHWRYLTGMPFYDSVTVWASATTFL